jgi:hypothetical protein
MDSKVSNGLKALFATHAAIAALFGLGFLLLPNELSSIYGLPVAVQPLDDVFRLIGAAMLGWGLSSALALRAGEPAEVRIVVAAEIAWTGLGALVMLYSLLLRGFPPLGWMNFAFFAAFAVLFTVLYPKR